MPTTERTIHSKVAQHAERAGYFENETTNEATSDAEPLTTTQIFGRQGS
jgi:hypothetical protein